jgi:hypothetical protein
MNEMKYITIKVPKKKLSLEEHIKQIKKVYPKKSYNPLRHGMISYQELLERGWSKQPEIVYEMKYVYYDEEYDDYDTVCQRIKDQIPGVEIVK